MIDPAPLAMPVLRLLEPEKAHELTIAALKAGLVPRDPAPDPDSLAVTVFGRRFPNPVGLAAGFDKNAEVPDAMLGLGFGFVEAGTVTPRPQPGNPRPRLFRAPAQRAVINRLGFNNEGLEVFADRLDQRRAQRRPGIVGANVGKNKETHDAAADYAIGIRRLAPLADYLVVNVSSPNTPGLRSLQSRDALADLLGRCLEARRDSGVTPPLLLKVAPDLTEADMADIAAVALASGIDGLVVSNTTVGRPADLPPDLAAQSGGLSGRPLFPLATRVLGGFYDLTEGRLPLIGVGGVASAADAYAKIRNGASLVQLYTALIYGGPGLVRRIKRDLADLLARDGFTRLADAIGVDRRPAAPRRTGSAGEREREAG